MPRAQIIVSYFVRLTNLLIDLSFPASSSRAYHLLRYTLMTQENHVQ
jgi:hypothetical protein